MAPYKSEAQRRYMHAAANRGEISKETVKEFDEASKGKKLPERAKAYHRTGTGARRMHPVNRNSH